MSHRNSKVAWLIVIVKVPAEPSRHRVAVWRELRRQGAVQLSPGTWGLPDVAGVRQALDRVRTVVGEASGESTVMRVSADGPDDQARLVEAYGRARHEDWAEFCADCDKLVVEISAEIGKGKLTFAELEEEEQSLDRLRRWYRTLRARDVLDTPGRVRADERLAACTDALADYEQRVYNAGE